MMTKKNFIDLGTGASPPRMVTRDTATSSIRFESPFQTMFDRSFDRSLALRSGTDHRERDLIEKEKWNTFFLKTFAVFAPFTDSADRWLWMTIQDEHSVCFRNIDIQRESSSSSSFADAINIETTPNLSSASSIQPISLMSLGSCSHFQQPFWHNQGCLRPCLCFSEIDRAMHYHSTSKNKDYDRRWPLESSCREKFVHRHRQTGFLFLERSPYHRIRGVNTASRMKDNGWWSESLGKSWRTISSRVIHLPTPKRFSLGNLRHGGHWTKVEKSHWRFCDRCHTCRHWGFSIGLCTPIWSHRTRFLIYLGEKVNHDIIKLPQLVE